MRCKKSKRPSSSKGKRDLSEVKELLGPLAARYTEAQLEQLSREMAIGASLLLDVYLRQKDESTETSLGL